MRRSSRAVVAAGQPARMGGLAQGQQLHPDREVEEETEQRQQGDEVDELGHVSGVEEDAKGASDAGSYRRPVRAVKLERRRPRRAGLVQALAEGAGEGRRG